jgi:hypothetical protein
MKVRLRFTKVWNQLCGVTLLGMADILDSFTLFEAKCQLPRYSKRKMVSIENFLFFFLFFYRRSKELLSTTSWWELLEEHSAPSSTLLQMS